jgi:hypothetical protein
LLPAWLPSVALSDRIEAQLEPSGDAALRVWRNNIDHTVSVRPLCFVSKSRAHMFRGRRLKPEIAIADRGI